MITYLEPDILECEDKWALESITTNKASGCDGIPVELFQILKDDVVKVLHSICHQIWKTQQWPALPWWLRGKSICLQCGRPGFDPWVRKILWRRKWQSNPVFLPGESHGWRSLIGYSPWGRKELDTTEQLHLHLTSLATGLEKVSFHSNPKERQCQRVLKLSHSCTHLTCY